MNSLTPQKEDINNVGYSTSKIIFDKSTKTGRLVHRITLGVIFNYIFFFFIGATCIAFVTIPAIYKLVDVSHISIWYQVFAILFDCWILTNIYLTNKLVKIQPKRIYLNNNELENIVKKFFPKAYLYNSGTNLLWYRSTSLWFDQDITILQDGNIFYINIIGLGRGESVVPFHGLANYIKCKKIARYVSDK